MSMFVLFLLISGGDVESYVGAKSSFNLFCASVKCKLAREEET
jgi:hypothetical protein